ncbi:MAG: hypothetical protein AVDCRST_MAG59-209, partial [uncultured Thermomicrobiales bacterium]
GGRGDRPLLAEGRPDRLGPLARGAGPVARLAAGGLARLPRRGRADGRERLLQPDRAGGDSRAHHGRAATGRKLGCLVNRTAGPDRRRRGRRRAGRRPRDRGRLRSQRRDLRGVGRPAGAAPDLPPRRAGGRQRQAGHPGLPRRRAGGPRLCPPRPPRLAPPGGPVARLPRCRGDGGDAGRPGGAAPGARPIRLRLADRRDRRRGARRPADPEPARQGLPGRPLVVRPLRGPGLGRRAAGDGGLVPRRARHPLRLRVEHRDRHGRLQRDGAGGHPRPGAWARLHAPRCELERVAPALSGTRRPGRRGVRHPGALLGRRGGPGAGWGAWAAVARGPRLPFNRGL